MSRVAHAAFAASLLLCSNATVSTAFADSVYWQGGTSSNWFTDSNWVWDGHAPGPSDQARIDEASPNSPVISSAGATAGTLFIGVTSTTGTLTIDGTGATASLATTTTTIGNAAGSLGSLLITGADASWTNSGAAYIGNEGDGTLTITGDGAQATIQDTLYIGAGGGKGTVTLEDSGALDVTNTLFVGYAASSVISELVVTSGTVTSGAATLADGVGSKGSASVTSADSSWTNTGLMTVGGGGVGSLTISGGGTVDTGSAGVGNLVSADGSFVEVSGSGSAWTVTGDLFIGNFGDTTLTIEDAGKVTSALSIIARLTGSTSSATVTGTGSLWEAGDLRVGGFDGATSDLGGDGTLTIEDGGKVSTSGVSAGDVDGASGTISVTDSGSLLESTGRIFIGRAGTGEITVSNGGDVTSVGANFANEATSTATVTLTGAGSSWTSTANIYVGNFGDATLSVLAGASLSGVDGYVGTELGSVSSATIDGAGSVWTNSGDFLVGHSDGSVGTVTISDGGKITDVQGLLGDLDGSSGTMTVTGTGSRWENTSDLNVGRFGTGDLTISDGGVVVSNRSYLGNEESGSGTVLITGAGSNWTTTTGRLFVGTDGDGELTLTDSGSVTTREVVIAYGANSTGTLNIGAAQGATAALAGTIDAPSVVFGDGTGRLVFNFSNASYTFSSTISGNGALYLAGNTLTLTGANSFSGGVTVAAGTLIGSTASLGTGNIVNNGTVEFAQASTGTYAGEISGSGALVKTGSGTLILTGDNSYTGGTTISEGTLQIGNGGTTGSVIGSIVNNAALVFYRSDTYDFPGTITGSGSVTILGGTVNFTGAGGYNGPIAVEGADLVLAANSSTGSTFTIESGGTIGGTGTIGGLTVLSGGTVAPGYSPGTITVAGDVSFAAGSTYAVEIWADGTHDLISATGIATLSGGTVAVLAQAGYANPLATYTILTAQGGVTGSFDTVTTNYAYLTPSLSYDASNVYLTLARNDVRFASLAQTPNETATANATESLGLGNAVYDAVLQLTAAQAPNAFDQLSGEVHASTQSLFMEQSSLIRGALNDRLRAAQGGVGASAGTVVNVVETSSGALAYAAPSPVKVAADLAMPVKAAPALAPVERFALWSTAFGNWGDMNGNSNAAGVSDSTGGFLIGADTLVGDGWRLGVAGGYSYTDFSISGRNSSGSSDNWHIGVYGGNAWGPLALRTGLAYTWQDISTNRSVAFTGYSDSLSADYDAGTVQAFGELGYRIDAAGIAFEPFANLSYVSLHQDGYTEEGGAAALTGDSQTMDTTFTTLGLRLAKEIAFGSTAATLRGALGWRHAFGDIDPTVTQAFAGSDAFTVTGAPIAEDAAVIEAGLDMLISPTATLGIAYTGQYGDGVSENGVNARLSVRF
ncbi:autotransporter outer membrane beta-barrel domain-containing protein [Ancylobacter sp. SL191]|uniref:autotransporter outer membrane beta-barrel domain-containing protein n=1 Tax=Ancylobacter sp. SL191 TaxID=2995166 RepID=UPI00226DA07D|nr:autotransporter domain-containing protein [Ancylobacter sp. SL191]WAC27609.1 autotransporter domain-containing protein [Ancylobacter sp. SL191]